MSLNEKFTFVSRTGELLDINTLEPVGTLLNDALVVDVDGFLMTVAEISYTLYHGEIQKHQRVIPIRPSVPLLITNLKVVDQDNIEALFSLPGYMNVEQAVLDVSAEGATEVSIEEAVAEAPVEELDPNDFVELMPNNKWRAYAMLDGKRKSFGEFKKKRNAIQCHIYNQNKPKP